MDEIQVIYKSNIDELTEDQKKLEDADRKRGAARKKTDADEMSSSKKRQYLIDAEIERIKKLEKQRAAAYSPKNIQVYNERIRDAQNNLKLLKGEYDQVIKKTNDFGGILKKVGAIAGIAFGVQQIISFGKAAIHAADEEAKAHQRLLTSLKGREDIQQKLIIQASELQSRTIFKDEDIVAAQSLIAAFTKEENQIKELTRVTLDFATAKEMDLTSAGELIAKTFASGTNALSRYGIQIEGAADSSERFESIVKNLDSAFLGQAEAATTGAGKMQQLANAWDDTKEKMGVFLIKALNPLFEGLKSMAEGLNDSLTNTHQLSEAIAKTNAEFNIEVQMLQESVLSAEQKDVILKELNRTYKSYLDNLGIEEINYTNLAEVARLVNQELEKKYIMQAKEEDVGVLMKKQVELKLEEVQLVRELTGLRKKDIEVLGYTREALYHQNRDLVKNKTAQEQIRGELIDTESAYKDLLNTLKEFIGPVNEIIKITGKESESITTLEESVKSLEEQWKAETDLTKRIDLKKQLIIATAKLAKVTGTLTEAEKDANKEKAEAIKLEENLNKLREEALKVTEELAEKIRELQIKNMEEGREKEMAVETERYKKAKKNAKDLYELESDYGILKEELLKEHTNNLRAIDEKYKDKKIDSDKKQAKAEISIFKDKEEMKRIFIEETADYMIAQMQLIGEYLDKLKEIREKELDRMGEIMIGGLEGQQKDRDELLEKAKEKELADNERALREGLMDVETYNEKEIKINDKYRRYEMENEVKDNLDKAYLEQILLIKKKEMMRRYLLAKKLMSLAEIGLNTTVAIMSALTVPPPEGEVFALLRAQAGITQLIAAALTPIPALAKGTKKSKAGLHKVGEKGEELVMLPQHSKVLPAEKTKLHSEIIDAMFDNRLEEYILKRYTMPAVKDSQGNGFDDYRLWKAVKNNKNVSVDNISEVHQGFKRALEERDYVNSRRW